MSKTRGSTPVLRGVSLDVRPGEFVSLLGPSGCGKTTLLRLIAGLDAPDAGSIVISGRDVTATKAHERPVHTVFQNYALFPHLSVFENVAFGLRLREVPQADVAARVAKALDLVRLGSLGERRISEISGGQSQRAALARALVLEPDVLLLDEPLAALDAQLRRAMRSELVELQRALGATFVLVTHDLEEAIECSSRIAVMREGTIAQFATPREIFERPASVYVAELVGMENLLRGRVVARERGGATIDLGFARVEINSDPAEETLVVGVHAEHVGLGAPGRGLPEGVVREARYLGEVIRCRVVVGGDELIANIPPRDLVRAGDRVSVEIAPVHWVPLAS